MESVAVDTWGVDYGRIGHDGELLELPFHYRDSRTDGMIQNVFLLIRAGDLYAAAGLQVQPFNTIFQLAAQAADPRWDEVETFLLTPDLLGFWLTGRRWAEVTIASTTGLLDPAARRWSASITDALRERLGPPLPRGLPELVEPGTVVGRMKPDLVPGDVAVVAVGGTTRLRPLSPCRRRPTTSPPSPRAPGSCSSSNCPPRCSPSPARRRTSPTSWRRRHDPLPEERDGAVGADRAAGAGHRAHDQARRWLRRRRHRLPRRHLPDRQAALRRLQGLHQGQRLRHQPAPRAGRRRAPRYALDAVVVDNVRSARRATESLFEVRFERVACVTGPENVETARLRLAGWRQAYQEAGRPAPDDLVRHVPYTVNGGEAGATDLLALPEPPDAIFAANNKLAAGVIRVLVERGLERIQGETTPPRTIELDTLTSDDQGGYDRID